MRIIYKLLIRKADLTVKVSSRTRLPNILLTRVFLKFLKLPEKSFPGTFWKCEKILNAYN